MRVLAILAVLFLTACTPPVGPAGGVAVAPPGAPGGARATFVAVVEQVAPATISACRAQSARLNCDFIFALDERAGVPPNAFQTVNGDGRPVVIFTTGLVRAARNRDELAFVLGHEAGHHIAGHIPRARRAAAEALVIGSVMAAERGLDAEAAETLARQAAAVGARRFAKAFELEADAIGTVIAAEAGFDPVAGAAFFMRLPDPGDRFLGTHPPNAERIALVRRVAAGL